MKKSFLLGVCIASVALAGSVQAFEKPNVSALKNVSSVAASKSASEKDAKQAALQKAFEASLVTANKNFAAADSLANGALWELGSIILDTEVMNDLKSRKGQEGVNDELAKALNSALKSKEFDSSELTSQNAKYVKAVTNLQISHNRYENIMNNMSPNFKKVLDGELSMISAKTQLVESGKLTKNVKSASMHQGSVLNKLNRINEKNSVYITIPDSEKVKYNKDGVVGSINYQLDTINSNVDKAYKELISAFNLKKEIEEAKATINNNPDLSKAEKEAKLQKVETEVLAAALAKQAEVDTNGNIKKLNSQQTAAITNATVIMTDSLLNYTSLGLACTKLGMQISAKPILAAPLALEVGQLKYTASVIKNSASSLKKVSTQSVKIAKANNIKVNTNSSKGSAIKKVNF